MRLVAVPDDSWFPAFPVLPALRDTGPFAGLEAITWNAREPHPRQEDIRFVVLPYTGASRALGMVPSLPNLEVVQLLSAGYEHVLASIPDGVTLCNAAGVHDTSTAELAVGLAVAAQRSLPDFVLAQRDHRWMSMVAHRGLADSRVLLVGYGNIGRAIARRLAPFEVTLAAVASRSRPGDEFVEQVHGVDQLPALLSDHDVVILAVPLTAATRGLVDRAFLAAMPDGALLVNVARGAVVDTAALLEACTAGRLRAALDVTDPEPLPGDHPLWEAPGVLITAHIGGATRAFTPRARALVLDQLQRYADGRSLTNVVRAGRVGVG